MFRKLFAAVVLFTVAAAAAPALELTTNLLTAEPGSWTRRHELDNYLTTNYVAEVTVEAVTLQVIRHHHGHIVSNKRYVVPAAYILENGANPAADDARSDTVEHDGATYHVKIARARVEDSDGDYYISDAVPGSGVIRLDILAGSKPLIMWTDAYGDAPDSLLIDIGPGEDAGAEYDFR